MITLIVFVSVFVSYVTIIFIRGVYREKKLRKQKRYEELSQEDIIKLSTKLS